MINLKTHWFQLFSSFENQSLVQEMYQKLHKHYSEPHRAYHTLEHIETCLDQAQEVIFEDDFAVNFALFFHDIIYNPRAKDNELQSALIAANFLQDLSCSPQVIDKVTQLIELTAHPSMPKSQDEKYYYTS